MRALGERAWPGRSRPPNTAVLARHPAPPGMQVRTRQLAQRLKPLASLANSLQLDGSGSKALNMALWQLSTRVAEVAPVVWDTVTLHGP